MSKIIDPILILRDYTVKGKKALQENDELIFGSTRIPLSAPTAWRKSGVQGAPEKHYTIGALWFYLANRTEEMRKYVIEAVRMKVGMVSPQDKEAIIEYFTGKIDKTSCIDEEYRLETHIKKYKKITDAAKVVLGERGIDEEAMELGMEEEAKFSKVTDKSQVLDYLKRNEKRIATRHSQLHGSKVFFIFKYVELFGCSNTST